uniref:Uncharacterized protein n=1 Tax=Cacopsylla melanoneura TaxID=428564 RepID=A0A8D9FBF9_9HEMI
MTEFIGFLYRTILSFILSKSTNLLSNSSIISLIFVLNIIEKSIKSSGNSSTTSRQCLKYVKSLLSMFERKSFNLFLKPFTLLIKSDISFLIFFLLLIFASRAAKRSLRAACGPRAGVCARLV